MRAHRSRHRWGPSPLSTSYWADIVRPEWVIALKRQKLDDTIQRMALPFLDKNRPGSPGQKCSVDAAWETILRANEIYLRTGQ